MLEDLTPIIKKLAEEAISFANSCIKISTARPGFNQTNENTEVKAQRFREGALAINMMRELCEKHYSCVGLVFEREPELFWSIDGAASAHRFSCGNCRELSDIGFWYIIEKIYHNPNYKDKLKVCLSHLESPGDHVFIIIKSKENPKLSYVCDPLTKQVYNESEIFLRMKSFKGDHDGCYRPVYESIKATQEIGKLLSSDDLDSFSFSTPLPNSNITNSILLRLMFKSVECFSSLKSLGYPFILFNQNKCRYSTEITCWIESKIRDSKGGESTCYAILSELMNTEMWKRASVEEKEFLTSLRDCLKDLDLTEKSFFPGVDFADPNPCTKDNSEVPLEFYPRRVAGLPPRF